jgi:small conductance mechanosensitive channel
MEFETIQNWFSQNQSEVIKVVAVFAVAFVIQRFGTSIITRVIQRSIRGRHYGSNKSEKQREKTLIQITSGALHVLVWPTAFLTVLPIFNIEIGPLLAGAGVAGVALGFGAQTLVKDIISGLFIIIEDHYRVGDVVTIADTVGGVEQITLRVTVLRDLDGVVHHVPNGEISVSSNMSKGYSGVNLNVGIGYEDNIEQAASIINQIGQDMASDDEWRDLIIEAPEFLRIDGLDLHAVTLKITGKTYPLKQWEVTGELRKRIKEAFSSADIDLPYQQQVIRFYEKHEHLPKGSKGRPDND